MPTTATMQGCVDPIVVAIYILELEYYLTSNCVDETLCLRRTI